jgi:HK97 family phage portal protein
VESKGISVEDISRFFGVPLYKINAGKQSYSSNEQNGIEYVVNTLHPIVTQYEEESTYKLLFDSELSRSLQIRINMMAELRGDFATRGAWYKNMREVGAFSVDDILGLEDQPKVPGGDVRLASLNFVPLEDFKRLSDQRNEGSK